MAIDVSHGGALVAGILSFASPCVLPLVPPYLCYMAGVSLDQLTDRSNVAVARRTVFGAALAFVLGFTTVFVTLGATASAIGRLVMQYREPLGVVAGILIIIMGLHFLGLFKIGLLYREKRMQVHNHPAGVIGSYFMGLAFAIGWTPCIGPVLGAILAVAGSEGTVLRGAGLLAVYSIGLGVPFLIAALFAAPFIGLMQRFRRHIGAVEKAMGGLLVVTGVLFITGGMQTLSFWLLNQFPALQQIG